MLCWRNLRRRLRGAFFFQAEDGIRDADVTGVQTCALPISRSSGLTPRSSGDAPELLGVRPEERVVQPTAEPRSHPLLERLGLGLSMSRGPQVRQRAERRLEQAESAHHVFCRDRIREVLALVEDAREARPSQEIVAEHLLPQTLDRLDLREE